MLNKYSENDPDFPGSSPMSLADLLQVSLPLSISHKWWCPSEPALDMLLLLLLTLVPSDLIDFPVCWSSFPWGFPGHFFQSKLSAASHAYWAPLFWCHMTFQTTPSTLLPLPDSEINTQLSKPDTWEPPLTPPSLHTRSLEPFTSHIQSLGSFPKLLCNLSYSNVLAQVNISSGLFQQPLHWSSFLAPSHPPAKAPSTPPLCSCACCSDGLCPG